jgi:hypothetical protein
MLQLSINWQPYNAYKPTTLASRTTITTLTITTPYHPTIQRYHQTSRHPVVWSVIQASPHDLLAAKFFSLANKTIRKPLDLLRSGLRSNFTGWKIQVRTFPLCYRELRHGNLLPFYVLLKIVCLGMGRSMLNYKYTTNIWTTKALPVNRNLVSLLL